MITWKKGPPDYSAELPRSRPIWIVIDWQGTWPHARMGYLYGRHTDDYDDRVAAFVQWLDSDGSTEPPPNPTVIPYLQVPALGSDKPLSDYWGISWHAEIEIPTIPEDE